MPARSTTICASPDGSGAFRIWLLRDTSDTAGETAFPDDSGEAIASFSVAAAFAAFSRARLDGAVALLERPSRACAGATTDLLYELDPHGVLVWLPDGAGWDPIVEPGAQLDRLWHAGLRWNIAALPDIASISSDQVLAGNIGAAETGAATLTLTATAPSLPLDHPLRPVCPVELGETLTLHLQAVAGPAHQVEQVELVSDLHGEAGQIIWRSAPGTAVVDEVIPLQPARARLRSRPLPGQRRALELHRPALSGAACSRR